MSVFMRVSKKSFSSAFHTPNGGKWLYKAVFRFFLFPIWDFVRCLSAIRKFFVFGALCALFVLQEPERSVHSFGYPRLRGLEHMGIAVQSRSAVAVP